MPFHPSALEVLVVGDAVKKYRDMFSFGLLAVAILYVISGVSLLAKSEDDSFLDFSGRAAVNGYLFTHPLVIISLAVAVALAVSFSEPSANARAIVVVALVVGGIALLLGLVSWLAGFGYDQIGFAGVITAGKVVSILLGLAQLIALGITLFFTLAAFQALPKKAPQQQQWGAPGYGQQQWGQQDAGQWGHHAAGQQHWGQHAQQPQQQSWGQPAAPPQPWGQHAPQQQASAPTWGQPADPQQWGQPAPQQQSWGQPQSDQQQSWAQPQPEQQQQQSWGQPQSDQQQSWGQPAPEAQPESSWGQPAGQEAQSWGPPGDDAEVTSVAAEPVSDQVEFGTSESAGETVGDPDPNSSDEDASGSDEGQQDGWWQRPST